MVVCILCLVNITNGKQLVTELMAQWVAINVSSVVNILYPSLGWRARRWCEMTRAPANVRLRKAWGVRSSMGVWKRRRAGGDWRAV